ncbi:MAG: PAS domain-containing protein, partial [Desulfobacterales bacterium]|nr:PAS domain-containing protein [Desulfobacterales bacterium]
MAGKPTYEELEKRVLELEKADSKGKNVEAALKKRILALTQPTSDTGSLSFEDLFNLDDIQRLQDEFALATGVASIITNTDGTPITQPSNFCRLCKDIIRKTETGLINCYKSDAVLGRLTSKGPAIQRCMSGGLWDAGAGISIGGQHIANWLIGQVRDVTQTEDKLRLYAREIGANESETIAAFREVPSMSRERFEQVAQVLFTLANQLSTAAYQNVQQARFITERKLAEEDLRESEKLLKETQRVGKLGSWSLDVLTGYLRWSDESYRIFGFRPQEFIPTYEKFQSIIHPEDLDFVLEQVDAALNNDKHYDVDFRFVRPNEEIGWIHCEGEVTRDAQGKPL